MENTSAHKLTVKEQNPKGKNEITTRIDLLISPG